MKVLCREGCVAPNGTVFLHQGQEYEVLDERDDFFLVHYRGPHKGWWLKSRFQLVEDTYNGEG